jgi:hypothetical protein
MSWLLICLLFFNFFQSIYVITFQEVHDFQVLFNVHVFEFIPLCLLFLSMVCIIFRQQPRGGVPSPKLHNDKRGNMPPHLLEGRVRLSASSGTPEDVRNTGDDSALHGSESLSLRCLGGQQAVEDTMMGMDTDQQDPQQTTTHQKLNSDSAFKLNSQNSLHSLPADPLAAATIGTSSAPEATVPPESQGSVLLLSLQHSEDRFVAAAAVILNGASYPSFSTLPAALTPKSNPSGRPVSGPAHNYLMEHLLDSDQVSLVSVISGSKDKQKSQPMSTTGPCNTFESNSTLPEQEKKIVNAGEVLDEGRCSEPSVRMLLEDLDWAAQGRHKPLTPGVLRRAVMDLVAEVRG